MQQNSIEHSCVSDDVYLLLSASVNDYYRNGSQYAVITITVSSADSRDIVLLSTVCSLALESSERKYLPPSSMLLYAS
jgi:hypothetical protein